LLRLTHSPAVMDARDLFRCKRCNKVSNNYKHRDLSARYLHGCECWCTCQQPNAAWLICLCCRERSPYYYRTYYFLNEKWYGQHFSSRLHTEAHLVFLENLQSFPNAGVRPVVPTHSSMDNAADFGPGNSSSVMNSVEFEDDDEVLFNVSANLLPPNFKTASFLTPEMVKYHKNEHERPGYGIACIVHDAFSMTEDVSTLNPEEVQFHIDACRLCIEIT
jgi:hypothetical protein